MTEIARLAALVGLDLATVEGWLAARYRAAGLDPVPLPRQPRAARRAVADLLAGVWVARTGKPFSP